MECAATRTVSTAPVFTGGRVHAWQWPAQLAIAVLALLSVLAALYAQRFGRAGLRIACVITTLGGLAAWYAFASSR